MRIRLPQLTRYVRRLISGRRAELSPVQRTIAFWTRLTLHCAGKLKRDKAPQVAAALTYHTLFSLIPMLVLGLLIFHSFRGLQIYADRFETLVIDVLLPEALLDTNTPPILSTTGPDPRIEFDDARQVMRERFSGVLRRVSELNLAGIGTVGLIVFLYGAISLLGTVESSFDSIYRAERRRSLRARLPLYFTIMTLGPVALVIGQVLQVRWLDSLATNVFTAWLAAPLATLSPLLATWLVVFTMFLTVPNTRVRWRSAASASLVSAFLWLFLQELFGLYTGSTVFTSLYGALAVFPVLLLWVFLSWLVILFGLELCYSLQHIGDEVLAETPYEMPVPGDPRWLLPILARIARGFEHGQATTRQTLENSCGLPLAVLLPFLDKLETGGMIHAVKDQRGEIAYTLAKAPTQISLNSVFDLAGLPRHEPSPAWDYLQQLRSKRQDTATDHTLQSVLDF